MITTCWILEEGEGGGGGMDTLLPPPQPLRLSKNPPTQNIRDRITNNAARLMVGCPPSRSRLVDGLRHESCRRAFPSPAAKLFEGACSLIRHATVSH